MAVTIDASSSGSATATSVTFSHTVSSGSNRLLIVQAAANTDVTGSITGATYGGTAMTQIATFDGNRILAWYMVAPPVGTANVVVSQDVSREIGAFSTSLFGVDQTTPVTGAVSAYASQADSGVTVTSAANNLVFAQGWDSAGRSTWTATGAQTTSTTLTVASLQTTVKGVASGASSVVMTWTGDTWNLPRYLGFSVSAVPAVLDQEAFRWGVDDGSESAHSWEAAQDTSVTLPDTQSRLIRMLVDTTGDQPSTAYTLRYQKNGTGGYTAVPVGASTSPTIGTPTIGTVAYSSLNGTSVAPSYPASIAADDTVVLIVGQKPSTANGGTVTTPSGWTLRASRTGATDGDTGGYTTTLGADTGNTNIFVYTKDTVAGTETGTLSVTIGTNNTCWAGIIRVPKTGTGTWSFAVDTGKDTTAGDVSIASSAGMDIAAGDILIGAMVIPTDVTTPSQFSAQTFAQTGTTFGTAAEITEPDTNVGDDIGGFIFYQAASSGSGSGAVTMTATAGGTTTNVRGPGIILRARLTGISNEVYVNTSANIAAGGEATTARLTAPSGKTTSDFVTGRRWDDENSATGDAIDITVDDYTEVEWLVALSSAPVNGDYYDFRVYAGSAALDTYTQTPRWTVGTAGPSTSFVYLRSIAPLLLH
jgi:hypothetical protein